MGEGACPHATSEKLPGQSLRRQLKTSGRLLGMLAAALGAGQPCARDAQVCRLGRPQVVVWGPGPKRVLFAPPRFVAWAPARPRFVVWGPHPKRAPPSPRVCGVSPARVGWGG